MTANDPWCECSIRFGEWTGRARVLVEEWAGYPVRFAVRIAADQLRGARGPVRGLASLTLADGRRATVRLGDFEIEPDYLVFAGTGRFG
jgi:hypothetical protein